MNYINHNMYENYYSNPNEENAFDDNKNAINNIVNDKNHYKFKKCFKEYTEDGTMIKRSKTIEYYGTSGIGSRIRDAITGFKTPHFFGTKNEDLYFSVLMCDGKSKNREPVVLFYDSPERYEHHQETFLPQIVKQKWQEKFMIAKTSLLMV